MKTPLFQAGTQRCMMAGIPRQYAILEGTIAAAFVVGMHNIWVLPFIIAIHVILVILYKKDPYYLEIILQHIKDPEYFDV